MARTLKNLPVSRIKVFKIRNRGGYAAICLGNLTEGKTPAQACNRLANPLKRMGFALGSGSPKVRASV